MHNTLSDDELLALIRAGDESAFVALYHRRQGGIYRFVYRMSGSESLAEDVTQDVFVAVIGNNSNYDPTRGSFSSYLYGIARNQLLRRYEKDRSIIFFDIDREENESLLDSLSKDGDPLGDLTRRETIETVRQAVLALPAHYRETIVLCDLHEMSYTEAAGILDCSIGTVRSRLHRGRALLIEKLKSARLDDSDAEPAGSVKCYV